MEACSSFSQTLQITVKLSFYAATERENRVAKGGYSGV